MANTIQEYLVQKGMTTLSGPLPSFSDYAEWVKTHPGKTWEDYIAACGNGRFPPTPAGIVWQVADAVNWLEVNKVDVWTERGWLYDYTVSPLLTIWQEKEVITDLSVTPRDFWMVSDEVSSLAIGTTSIWKLQDTISNLPIAFTEEGAIIPPPTPKPTNWWLWVIGGAIVVILAIYLARRK